MTRPAMFIASVALLVGGCGDPGCPPTEPDPWADCLEGDRASPACGIVLPVETGLLTATEPSFTCEEVGYFGPSACNPDYDVEPSISRTDEGGSLWYPVPGPLNGSSFRLRYTLSTEGTGAARLCRVGRTDVMGGDCWPGDWDCAVSGSVTVDEDESGAPTVEFTATFADGGVVTGAL